ncbi:hypothetical protein AT15_05575 [Kosmotoga arenicorallina S304]|uniref:Uncharacterized protein n=1 Tax=Kosmotoga arenicorallina S304 TaxID=1453497 RepID=A0A182C7H1_9BACT|nr:hypothetical protein [Kosmotoga arenicorallina]OAA31544.1 hypothetical protein AT15_05575 [Kosmotoga arenicorallina S304]
MKKPLLFFYYSHESNPARASFLPVMAWLCEERGIDYDAYFAVRPSLADIGDFLPFAGNRHEEQFYFLTNFYDKVKFFALSENDNIPFERFLAARGDQIFKRKSFEIVELYDELFTLADADFPDSAVVFPSKEFEIPDEEVELGDFRIEGKSRIDTFFYPDIFFRKALGINFEQSDSEFEKLRSRGVKKLFLACCPKQAVNRFSSLGFETEVIEYFDTSDTLLSLTGRICKRWIDLGKGIALGNDPITLRWTPKYLRERILPIASVNTLQGAVEVISELAEKTGNYNIWGSQVFDDGIIAEFSKKGIVLNLAHDVEIGITLRSEIKLPALWLKKAPSPTSEEITDSELIRHVDNGDVPVCFVHYAADIGHLPVLPRYLDLHTVKGIRDGIAFPANWWDYAGETLEQIYIPRDQGGIFPTSEPMVSSLGTGVGTEAEGYFPSEEYLKNLLKAREKIAEKVGEGNIPLGYYSFQDSCPKYKHNTAEPQFEIIREAGFEYAITYKSEGKYPEVIYEDQDFIVLNQQSEHWSFSPFEDLLRWERELSGVKKSWIIIGLDSPFWGMVPCYFGVASKGLDLSLMRKTMLYASKGGKSGKLFIVKPHELVRYVKLILKK